ncbi:MAG: restriction endonuclease subunit M [Erysipelotrichaceae bacterium]|nr:restriction endonuclease subunit M [Erysipelotrichaceae bacterium]MBQ6493167.1 restriction endonuclease subunit M [Erysipelotrichaceae bacterium]
MVTDINKDLEEINDLGLLDRLLKDKTTNENIIWGTDAYCGLGVGFGRTDPITANLLIGPNAFVIRNRASKESDDQSDRTRQHAEVFTPFWIVNRMNNFADEVWFGYKNVFNTDGIPTMNIEFPEEKTWESYVDSDRLEITCGEAPFLVSRYDVESGDIIPVKQRIGILDRKLRVVNENADTEDAWLEWTIKAFQSTYGYEFQGDSLLIARINLLMTFKDYMLEKWHRVPTIEEFRKIVNIISWNIWQMDGLTGTIPYSAIQEDNEQLTFDLFADAEEVKEEKKPGCRIFDWHSNNSIEFSTLKRRY